MSAEADEPTEEILGEVRDEHYTPREKIASEIVRAERKEWSDRTFYVLSVGSHLGREQADLNRQGWAELRALCDTVLERISQDEVSS